MSLFRQIQKYVEIMADLEPIRLSRSKLEKFVHLPFFKKLVIGCFVKIGIGAVIDIDQFFFRDCMISIVQLIKKFQNNGRSVYRLVEVCDVLETAKVYNLGKAKTNIGLRYVYSYCILGA
jgi:RNA polymerase-associated protein RTF1